MRKIKDNIGVVAKYKIYFEIWKNKEGIKKYGRNVNFIFLNTSEDIMGRNFKAVEVAFKYDLDVYEQALLRIK